MRGKAKWIAATCVLFLALAVIVIWATTFRGASAAIEVQHLVGALNDDFSPETIQAINKINLLGERAYPELRRIYTWRESRWNRLYARVWSRLPSALMTRVPRPDVRSTLQGNLQDRLPMMGPAICRAMTGAVCDMIGRGDQSWREMSLLRPLIWSIPESPRAVLTLSNYLAQMTNTFLFGSLDSHVIWRGVPELIPLLAQWLKRPDAVHDVALTLASLGTNAAFAVPLLVEASRMGVAGEPPDLLFRVNYPQDPIVMNRSAATAALGKTGVTNAAVIAALVNAAESKDLDLCWAAFMAAQQLGLPLPPALRKWSDEFKIFEEFPEQNYQMMERFRSLGELGSRASNALPLLRKAASGQGWEEASRLDFFNQNQAEQLRMSAAAAIFRIDPREALPFLPYLLTNFLSWHATEALRAWKSERERIIPVVSRGLDIPEHRMHSAYILASLAPELEKPRKILFDALNSANFQERTIALNHIWRVTEDAQAVLPVARALLKDPNDEVGQNVLNVLEQMGPAALPAVPELKGLLHNYEWPLRERAGKLLRKLAPDEMPPIVE